MKHYTLLLLLCTLPFLGQSQLRVTAGPTLGYQNTWLLNPNIILVGDEQPEPTFNMTKGFEAEVRLLKWITFHTGFESSSIAQDFVVSDEEDNEYEANHTLKTSNIPMTLRFGTGFYFESGFTRSIVNSATWTYDGVETNVEDDFAKSNWMITGGFGGDIILKDKLLLNLGVRTNYAMKDYMGIDAHGRSYESMTFFTDLYNQGVDITEIPGHEPYLEIIERMEGFTTEFDKLAKTYALSIGVYTGIKWIF